MEKVTFELVGDYTLKQALVSSLLKILADHNIIIMKKKYKSITIPQIGNIKQAIFQALKSICRMIFVLK